MTDLRELALDPAKFDDLEARLWDAAAKMQSLIDELTSHLHIAAGDKKQWYGRIQLWKRTYAEVERDVRFLAEHGDERIPLLSCKPSELLSSMERARTTLAQAMTGINEMEGIWASVRWQRFFPCLNRDGHIHATFRDCRTVQHTTAMAWRPDLSGLTVEQAVKMPPEGLGPALCSVCFPDAPVEWSSKTLGQVELERTAADRAAAQTARDAVKAAKNLTGEEQFRDTWGWVTTVAGCIKVLRDEVEYRDYYGNGEHPSHAATAEAAVKARAVLTARFAKNVLWGKSDQEIDEIIRRAVVRNRKAGARLDEQGKVII